MNRAALLLVVGLIAGCAHTQQITWRLDEPEAMRQTLADQLPEGTALAAAQQFMEHEGFTCMIVRNGTFVEKTWFGAQVPIHENIDFLECRRVQSDGLLMSRYWGVALVLSGDSVQKVLVSHYIDGP